MQFFDAGGEHLHRSGGIGWKHRPFVPELGGIQPDLQFLRIIIFLYQCFHAHIFYRCPVDVLIKRANAIHQEILQVAFNFFGTVQQHLHIFAKLFIDGI
ncbi:MAG: hypothetical protein HC858_08000 [Brachymonas sp.]|nr:hypothetical protein [Brachymonas sp.]